MAKNLQATELGASIYVLGTADLAEARQSLPADIESYGITETGWYVRRQGYLRLVPANRPRPKDARQGVRFSAVRRQGAGQ